MKEPLNESKIYEKSREGQISLVLRHSIREEIQDARNSEGANLTEEGRLLAEDFGSKIPKDRYVRLFHSPVERCKETADLILKGFQRDGGKGKVCGSEFRLGCPYILDPDRLLGLVNELSGPGFVSEWMSDNIDAELIESKEIATDKLFMFIGKKVKPSAADVINIHITHDFNIILLLALVKDLKNVNYSWPGYLDGAIIVRKEDIFQLSIRDKEVTYSSTRRVEDEF